MDPYLEATELIDWHTPSIASLATTLRGNESDPASIAGRCFEFVHDEINIHKITDSARFLWSWRR